MMNIKELVNYKKELESEINHKNRRLDIAKKNIINHRDHRNHGDHGGHKNYGNHGTYLNYQNSYNR